MPAMDALGDPASAPMGRGVGEGEQLQRSCDRAWRSTYITELERGSDSEWEAQIQLKKEVGGRRDKRLMSWRAQA